MSYLQYFPEEFVCTGATKKACNTYCIYFGANICLIRGVEVELWFNGVIGSCVSRYTKRKNLKFLPIKEYYKTLIEDSFRNKIRKLVSVFSFIQVELFIICLDFSMWYLFQSMESTHTLFETDIHLIYVNLLIYIYYCFIEELL